MAADCQDQEGWRFKCDDGVTYTPKNLPSNFIEHHNVQSGITVIATTKANKKKSNGLHPNELYIPPGAILSARSIDKTMEDRTLLRGSSTDNELGRLHRYLNTPLQGNSVVLVIRVIDETGDDPPQTAAQYSNFVFGTAGDVVNLKSQTAACSGGKLNFVPAAGTDITDGVANLVIPHTVAGVDRMVVLDWVEDAIANQYPSWQSGIFQHRMYVFPKSVDFRGAAAIGYLNEDRTVFYGGYIKHILMQMHEIGT